MRFAPCFVRENTSTRRIPTSVMISVSSARLSVFSTKKTSWSTFSAVVECGTTATVSGCFSSWSASSWASRGIVAEKNSVCRTRGSIAITLRTSWMNPMSSMRSASSSTNTSSDLRLTSPCPDRSSSRPGVATRMSMPARSACFCASMPTPPKITKFRSGSCLPYTLKLSPIWAASSRVGVRIRQRIGRPWRAGAGMLAARRCRIGSANAAVLPVPVCARPSKSRPARTNGIALAWIGVGSV